MTSHSTPNKYEVFISVAREFTIISALEISLLLYIYVGLQAEGCEQVCVCTHACACKRTLFKLIALAHKTFWICLHS